jgi:beta-phosphoglucomutase
MEAIIWDMNGVLLDDESFQWEAFKRVLGVRGVPIPEEDFDRYCGVTERECFALALSVEADHSSVRECMDERRRVYQEIMGGRLPLYPGAREAVMRAAERGYVQAIASGACREEVLMVAGELGMRHFRAIVAAEDVSRGKPHPEGYLKAADQLGISPARCLVVEDSTHGVDAALAAGMRCIAVAHTLPLEKLSRAHRVAPSLDQALRKGLLFES